MVEISKLREAYQKLEPTLSEEARAFVSLLLNIVEDLLEENRKLKSQLSLNSHNSSQPPSSDGFKKPIKSNRPQNSVRKAGGQPGHPGHTLEMVSNPDEVITHSTPSHCWQCGTDLSFVSTCDVEKRQLFELPEIKLKITEHQSEKKVCPHCGRENHGTFPSELICPTQYGSNVKALLVYFNNYQLIPSERCCGIFKDLFGHSLSPATLHSANEVCYKELAGFEQVVKEKLTQSEVAHFDETGMRCGKKREWLHVASTDKLTYYSHHSKRGKEATEAIGILPLFNGIAVHDNWANYFSYNCQHSLCNTHHLRDLTFVEEEEKRPWAEPMKKLLLDGKKVVDKAKEAGFNQLLASELSSHESEYDQIIKSGLEEEPLSPTVQEAKRGKKKQSKSKNLLDRFQQRKVEILRFMNNFQVPFDNNLAERDLRMMKLKQKISGCFRGKGGDHFCRIRGYISTLKKSNQNVIQGIQNVFHQEPWDFQFL
jgi:transposase